MAGEDLRLADPIIGEEAVSRLRVRPVLACERQASPDRARHTLDEFAQALAQTLVHEHASGELALPPGVDCRVHGAPHPQVTWCPTRNHAQSRPRNPSSPLLKMWVIERRRLMERDRDKDRNGPGRGCVEDARKLQGDLLRRPINGGPPLGLSTPTSGRVSRAASTITLVRRGSGGQLLSGAQRRNR